MAASTPSTIKLKTQNEWFRKERLCAEAITPGQLLEVTAAGKYQKHGTAGATAIPIFAVEIAEIGDDIDTASTSGDQIPAVYASTGDEIYAYFLDNTTAATPAKFLQSDGNGNLKTVDETTPSSTGSGVIVARALETQATVSSATRLKVEVV